MKDFDIHIHSDKGKVLAKVSSLDVNYKERHRRLTEISGSFQVSTERDPNDFLGGELYITIYSPEEKRTVNLEGITITSYQFDGSIYDFLFVARNASTVKDKEVPESNEEAAKTFLHQREI